MRCVVEICCGSFYDAKQAALGGAGRIELNSALHLGGLTPTAAVLRMVKEELDLKVITMVRPRGAGFCYHDDDFRVMLAECEDLLRCGADGIAFGCLKEDASLDLEKNKKMVDLIKKYEREAVFHRAFDCSKDGFATMEQLIGLSIDRVLTSGLKPKAMEGKELLRELWKRYGGEIEILAGSGINSSNARLLMDETGLTQVHSSCKAWLPDRTTTVGDVTYVYGTGDALNSYDVVSKVLVEELIRSVEDM